jgi:hypothetical protein
MLKYAQISYVNEEYGDLIRKAKEYSGAWRL